MCTSIIQLKTVVYHVFFQFCIIYWIVLEIIIDSVQIKKVSYFVDRSVG